MYEETQLINNQSNHSFELFINGQRAFINYRQQDNTYLLIHTEVPENLQGQGIAGRLVEKTLEYLEANHFEMKPYCAYIQAYLKKYPEWHRLVAK